MDNWLRRESLREIRFDGVLTLLVLALAFFCYGEMWWLLALALLGRGFLISFFDNIYHYETPVSDVFFAKNLHLPAPLATLLLNFNLHGIHHVNPAIPWIHLPRAFNIQAGRFQGSYFAAALRQLHGPLAIQDLPHAKRNA
jgi:fatty acid desaturase